MESIQHLTGKKLARIFLNNRGFKDNQIFEEYTFEFKSGKRRRIDLVGIKKEGTGEYKIAIEIGILNGGSLEELEGYFDEVYNFSKFQGQEKELKKILNFLKDIEFKLNSLEERNKRLHTKLVEANKHLEFLKDFYAMSTGEMYSKDSNGDEILLGMRMQSSEEIEKLNEELNKVIKNFIKIIESDISDKKINGEDSVEQLLENLKNESVQSKEENLEIDSSNDEDANNKNSDIEDNIDKDIMQIKDE